MFREISLFLKELVLGFEKLFWFLKLTCVLGNHFVFLEIDLIINVKLDKSVKKKQIQAKYSDTKIKYHGIQLNCTTFSQHTL